jgi:hypothetical protein
MDDDLAKYRDGLKERAEREVPKFAPEAVHTAPILALLLEPDNSGAAESRMRPNTAFSAQLRRR